MKDTIIKKMHNITSFAFFIAKADSIYIFDYKYIIHVIGCQPKKGENLKCHY